MFKLLNGREGTQRGITGLETAIILIAFVVVASVFAFTVLSTGIFSSERSKETVFAGLDEIRSSLEPRGSVIAYKGRYSTTSASDTIYKVTFVVSNAVQGEAINLTPPYTANGASIDPDVSSGAQYAQYKMIVSFTDQNQFLNDVPWSVTWPGYDNSDDLLDPGEKAEITIWLFDRDFGVTNATDNSGIILMNGVSPGGDGGFANMDNIIGVNDKWTIELKPESGETLNIERTMPARLDSIMDLRIATGWQVGASPDASGWSG
jgi:flagellin FlaB